MRAYGSEGRTLKITRWVRVCQVMKRNPSRVLISGEERKWADMDSVKINAREDNAVSKTHKTWRRQKKRKGKVSEHLPLLQVDGLPIHRSNSQASVFSVESYRSALSTASAVSAFSNAISADIETCEKDWHEIFELPSKKTCNNGLIKTELQVEIHSCSKQRNVNMTIKDILKKNSLRLAPTNLF